MNFRTKIFLSLLLVSVTLSIGIFISAYFITKKEATAEFLSRYNSLGNVIANTFHQMGEISDQVNKNAVTILKTIDQFTGIPSNKNLAVLAGELGIQGFYAINGNGRFVRSSDLPLSMQKNSLFSYCAGYRNLIHGNLNKAVTPIIPSYPYGIPSKFIMIPNRNRTLILEAGIHLNYIGEILHKAIQYNKNITSIGLFSPNGYTLGFISSHGKFTQGKNKIPISSLSGSYIKNKTIFLNFKILASVGYCCECKIKHVQNINPGAYYYILQMRVSLSPLMHTLSDIKIYFSLLFIIALTIIFVVSKFLAGKLVERISKMNDVIKDILLTGNMKRSVNVGSIQDEISELAKNFNTMIRGLDHSKEMEIEYERTKEIEKISKQVAHDIRSPLSSLEMLIKRLPNIEESKYILLRDAIAHIRDITNNLEKNSVGDKDSNANSMIQIAVLLDYVISERRTAFSDQLIKIEHDFSAEAYAYFVDVIPSEVKRILTNVINNAREALMERGDCISIMLEEKNNYVIISVCDNGIGISPNSLSLLFKRGFTTKKSGSGLGLSHARETLELWGGSINIIPNTLHGVSVFITLPLKKQPNWFIGNLSFSHEMRIVCVDDSISIYHGWNERFKSVTQSQVNLIHCKDKEELLSELENKKNSPAAYLVDYEFSGKNYNGSDLINLIIKAGGDRAHIYLVTSRSNEQNIQMFCEITRIKMIPKHFVFKIPLKIL